MSALLVILYFIFTLIALYHGCKSWVWEIGSVIFLLLITFVFPPSVIFLVILWVAILAIALIIRSAEVRTLISNYLFNKTRNTIPKLSSTEEEALNAGDTWLEQDIFIGKPDWNRLHAINAELTEEEKSFLNNEVHTLCSMLDEWTINQTRDLPEKVWKYMKDNGFFGLIIKKEYGGRGFSARAHSEVVLKVSSCSGVAAVTVMVPNSLGPGELLHHYGTDEQKNYYLPRLAKGIEIPCFALTEPEAGSDATSLQSEAIVEERMIDGQSVLGLRINLNKRWITLSPIATLIGLAVNLKDPNNLLKGVGKEGITCVFITRDTENLEIGNRHLPAEQPFMNGTIRGENIFAPIENIIGGQEMAGSGWRMLVECLSIGRSISLPTLAAGSSSVAYITSGAFTRIRRQFNVELCQFEGIEEKLAEIAGLNYLINATRLLTAAAVDHDKKPSVASAITKYFNTELSRIVINAAMDVHGGRAVVVGPRNYLSNFYQSLPIAITVEGANIMSRNLLIFGQGSMACHPYVRDEFYAIAQENKASFNGLVWKHIHYSLTNFAKAFCSAWTGGIFIGAPDNKLKREYQRLARLSHAFAWISDLALIMLGGKLKRKERLSARLADAMSYLYMAMAALRLYEKNPNEAYKIHTQWATRYAFYHAQKALFHFTENFPSPLMGWFMRIIALPGGQTMAYPSDRLDHKLAQLMTSNNDYRDFLLKSVALGQNTNPAVERVEYALQLLIKHHDLYQKISDSKRVGALKLKDKLMQKQVAGELNEEEVETILAIEKARWDAILVDEFDSKEMKKAHYDSVINKIKNPFD